jgi:hypothetical protein
MDFQGLHLRPAERGPIYPPASTEAPAAPVGPDWGRGSSAVNAVKMEVEALIQNVEPELAACGAVMVAYVACASVFISLFL